MNELTGAFKISDQVDGSLVIDTLNQEEYCIGIRPVGGYEEADPNKVLVTRSCHPLYPFLNAIAHAKMTNLRLACYGGFCTGMWSRVI